MSNDIPNINALNPEMLKIINDLNKKRESGEVLDPNINEALSALNTASRIMNTIMNGGQIDPVFFSKIIEDYKRKISAPELPKKKIIKKKKLNKS